MNKKALKTLEFDKIINQLMDFAFTDLGKASCKNLVPMTSLEEVQAALLETTDALSRILRQGSISFSGVYDIREGLKRLEVGSTLGIPELLRIAKLLETANRVKSYGRKDEEEPEDSLTHGFSMLEPLTPLAAEIRRCIISEEEISDDASPGLHGVRRSMKQIHDKIRSHLSGMVGSQTTRTYLQDAVVTMRNGRYCLPVKAEHRGQIQGMIHDQSSTGSTLFVEPMAIVKYNNDLKDLEAKEQEEIEKILADLSNQVQEYSEMILTNFSILTQFDFIFAKAMLSKSYQGTCPKFNTEGIIDIKKGRHPLLDKQKVVPMDIRLGETFDLLIVTGPNTGGKTVSLKTTGLFTLMGQAGLHIPAFDNSRLGLFEEVFADIGDEQSIEQNLSTFSSHMTNIVNIVNNATDRSLVLFDELGAGTDPVEGAALAVAILSSLHKQKIRTMATTHYSELKIFALSTEGVENASCEFDVATLRPTYRLLIGIPGKSNAFAISEKLGLPSYLIDDAKLQINAQNESLEDILAELEAGRITIEKEQAEIAEYKAEIEKLKQTLESKKDKLDKRREDILQKANEEARAILQEAKDVADESIRKFNHLGKNTTAKDLEESRSKIRNKMNKVDSSMAKRNQPKSHKQLKASDLHIGDMVKVLSMGAEGTVSTLPNDKGQLFVQMGIIRSQVNIRDLQLADEPVVTTPTFQKTGTGKIKMSKTAQISPELQLLGYTCDEAISILDKYLDDAYLSHLNQVRIVHGKGTGALRTAVHNHLKRQKYVKSYRLGAFGEGDAGVTIVEFK